MAFKSIKDIPDIQESPRGPSRYFFDRARQKEIEKNLDSIEPRHLQYEPYRQQLANELAFRYKYSPEQINDTLDSYLTKATYYNNTKLNNYKKQGFGRFELGSDLFDAQNQARQVLRDNPSAYAVVYGLFPTEIQNPQNIGLKKPIPVQDYNELKDINDSLVYGNGSLKLRPEVFYRDRLNDK